MKCDVTTPCYACGIHATSGRSYSRSGYDMFEVYEACVETIEAQTSGFRIADIWRVVRSREEYRKNWYTGSIHTRATYAVHDMARHGLIRCIRKARNNHNSDRCLEWRVVR